MSGELKFATVEAAMQYLAEVEGKKVVVAATTAPARPITKKQPRTIPMPQPKNRGKDGKTPGKKELKFTSTDEALTFFAGLMNAKIVVGRSKEELREERGPLLSKTDLTQWSDKWDAKELGEKLVEEVDKFFKTQKN